MVLSTRLALLAAAVAAILVPAAVFTQTPTATGATGTPTATATVAGTPAATPTAAATPEPSATPESLHMTFVLRSEITDGRQQQIPEGTEFLLRGPSGICARAPVDAAALNAGDAVAVADLAVTPSACGGFGAPVTAELLFPGEDRGGYLNFSSVLGPDLAGRQIELVIPAPVPLPLAPGVRLPSTGSATGSSTNWGLFLIASTLVVGGALALLPRKVRRR